MNTIEKYCSKFNVNFLPALNLCADVNKTYSITRREVIEFEFPNVEYFDDSEISVSSDGLPEKSSYFGLTSIPSETAIDCAQKKCVSASVHSTTIFMRDKIFSVNDLDALKRVHLLKYLKRRSLADRNWLLVPLRGRVPPSAHILDEKLIHSFSEMLFDAVDGYSVNPYDKNDPSYQLTYFDLSTLSGGRWVSLAMIETFIFMLNKQYSYHRVFSKAALDMTSDDVLIKIVESWKSYNMKSVNVILNVRKNDVRDIFPVVAMRGEYGNHWAVIHINFQTKAVLYCDSLGWPIPQNIDESLKRILDKIEQQFNFRPSLSTSSIAHDHSNLSGCTNNCLSLPFQGSNMDICGLAALASTIFLMEESDLRQYNWTTSLEEYHPFLRCFFICSYMIGNIGPLCAQPVTSRADNTSSNVSPTVAGELDEFSSSSDLAGAQPMTLATNDTSNVSPTIHGEVGGLSSSSDLADDLCTDPVPSIMNSDSNMDVQEHDVTSVANHDSESKSESENPNIANPATNDVEIFRKGASFNSFLLVQEAMEDFKRMHHVELRISNCSTLKSAAKKAPNRVQTANPVLEYYFVYLACKFGGKPIVRERKRKTKSMRSGCPFIIKLILSPNGQSLVVQEITNKHNHTILPGLIKHLPKQRALTEAQTKFAIKSFMIKGNKKLIHQKLLQEGKQVTLKDLTNLQQACKIKNGNDIRLLVQDLSSNEEAVIEVVVGANNEFNGLLYQDRYMLEMYANNPEMILVDATFKLLDTRYPLFLILTIDANGLSDIVAVIILSAETKEIIKSVMEQFQKHNPQFKNTAVVMSDKDFNERAVFAQIFPNAVLLICLFHTFRSFKREITCEKMGLTTGQRNRCLEILQAMVYSRSPEEYNGHESHLNDSNFNSVKEYFKSNWQPIKEQWVICFKDINLNLGEGTNNRLESTFQKVKSVCDRYASLRQFFQDFGPAVATGPIESVP